MAASFPAAIVTLITGGAASAAAGEAGGAAAGEAGGAAAGEAGGAVAGEAGGAAGGASPLPIAKWTPPLPTEPDA